MTYGSDWFTYDFKTALNEARERTKKREAASAKTAEADETEYMRRFASGELAATVTYGTGRPTVANHGKVISVEAPTDEQLKRHRLLYGPDCVEIEQEKRSATELREDGLSVREIARVPGISERSAKARLGLAA